MGAGMARWASPRIALAATVSDEELNQTDELSAVVDRAVRSFGEDERVRALFLAGSRATGGVDRYSDLDLLVVVADEAFESFCEDWPSWLEGLAETVASEPRSFARSFLVNATTPSCARVDVLVRPVSAAEEEPGRDRPVALFDLDGVAQRLPSPQGPFVVDHDAAWLSNLVYTFIRTLSLLPMLLARGEVVRLTHHVQSLKQDLLELLLFDNGDPPARRPGAWAWVDLPQRLPAADLAMVAGLPALAATHERIVRGHLAVAGQFLPRARNAVARTTEPWPSEFERAVQAFLERELGTTFADNC